MSIFFFFNDTATTEIYTLSLHDALPICHEPEVAGDLAPRVGEDGAPLFGRAGLDVDEEDTAPAQGEGERDLAPDPPGAENRDCIHRLASPAAAARTTTFIDSPRRRLRLVRPRSHTPPPRGRRPPPHTPTP